MIVDETIEKEAFFEARSKAAVAFRVKSQPELPKVNTQFMDVHFQTRVNELKQQGHDNFYPLAFEA